MHKYLHQAHNQITEKLENQKKRGTQKSPNGPNETRDGRSCTIFLMLAAAVGCWLRRWGHLRRRRVVLCSGCRRRSRLCWWWGWRSGRWWWRRSRSFVASISQDNHHQLLILETVVFDSTYEVVRPRLFELELGVSVCVFCNGVCCVAIGVVILVYLNHCVFVCWVDKHCNGTETQTQKNGLN